MHLDVEGVAGFREGGFTAEIAGCASCLEIERALQPNEGYVLEFLFSVQRWIATHLL